MTITAQDNRGLPIVNVTASAVNFSTPAMEYIAAEVNQFILSKTDKSTFLIPVEDTVNFSSSRYDYNDTRVLPSICILKKKKEGSDSKSNRITSMFARTIEEGKYKIVRQKLDTPIILKYIGRANLNDIKINTIYEFVQILEATDITVDEVFNLEEI